MGSFRRLTRASDKRADFQFNEVIKESDMPPPHADTHKSNGSDPLTASDIGANSITNFNSHAGAGNPHNKSQVRQGGATEDRPETPEDFEFYFDTDLGKPIWYSGTEWVDATGTAV